MMRPHSARRWRLRCLAAAGSAAAFLAVSSLSGAVVPAADEDLPEAQASHESSAELVDAEAEFGIRIVGVRRTAADYMLDFRFTVLDPKKAAVLMDRAVKPVLIHERTGNRLSVPVSEKIGPLRQAPNEARGERTYFMFFANPGRRVKAGDAVSLVIGDFEKHRIVVD